MCGRMAVCDDAGHATANNQTKAIADPNTAMPTISLSDLIPRRSDPLQIFFWRLNAAPFGTWIRDLVLAPDRRTTDRELTDSFTSKTPLLIRNNAMFRLLTKRSVQETNPHHANVLERCS